MRSIFSYESYKQLILDKIQTYPDKGRGVTQKLSEHMRVNPSFVSQVLKGDKHFSSEQIFSLTRFFSLTALERDFVFTLQQLERAGTHELKAYLEEQIANLRKKSKFVSKRLTQKMILTEHDQARYYSDWLYSATRLFCLQKNVNLKVISEKFGISSQKASEIIEFLMSVGLITNEGQYFKTGVVNTHLPANSPFIAAHHKNWRLKAMAKHSDLSEDELAFSAPFGIDKKSFALIKDDLLDLIAKVSARVNESPNENLACLNIDLFHLD